MTAALDRLLRLGTALDDTSSAARPRQHFRQALVEQVADSATARVLLHWVAQTGGPARQRVIQDLVVLLGRFLGFTPVFGAYDPLFGILRYDGLWQSPRRRDVLIETRIDDTDGVETASLSRLIAAHWANAAAAEGPSRALPLGLFVVSSSSAARPRLERALAARPPGDGLRMISLESLLTLADMGCSGRLGADDTLRLFDSAVLLDGAVSVLSRPQPTTPAQDDQVSRCWVATIAGTDEIPLEVVESSIRQHHVFKLRGSAADTLVQPHDHICFSIPGVGVVGHARVASTTRERPLTLLHLERIELYPDRPVAPTVHPELPRTGRRAGDEPAPSACRGIGPDEFAKLTSPGPGSR
jgi:hypothetical protein